MGRYAKGGEGGKETGGRLQPQQMRAYGPTTDLGGADVQVQVQAQAQAQVRVMEGGTRHAAGAPCSTSTREKVQPANIGEEGNRR